MFIGQSLVDDDLHDEDSVFSADPVLDKPKELFFTAVMFSVYQLVTHVSLP